VPSDPGPRASLRWPLVGRDDALDHLDTALRTGHRQAALLHGAAGVGKSRLADELLDRHERRGDPALRVTASAASAAVPLAALAPLLPPDAFDRRFDPAPLVDLTVARLRERPGPSLILVDDAHHLDPTSLALIGQLLDRQAARVVATVRSGERRVAGPGAPAAPAGLDALARRPDVEPLELTELSPADTETLLTAVLGAPVDAAAVEALWARTQGNVLFLRELTTDASAAGTLAAERGQWGLRGPLPTPQRLTGAIRARLDALDGDAQRAVELIATWEPAGLADVEAAVGGPIVATLDRAGLLDVRTDQRRRTVALAHPLYGEVVRDGLPSLARRRLRAQRAAAVAARGGRRRSDPVEIVTAALDGDRAVDAGLLLHAGHLACYGHDYEQCVRLARIALAAEVSAEAVLLLAEGLVELGAAGEVEDLLATHDRLFAAADDEVALTAYSLRVRNLVYGLQRPDMAVAVQATATARFGAEHREILANEGIMALFSGRPRDALVLAGRFGDADIRDRTQRATVEANALCVTGACEQALAVAQQGFVDHLELGDSVNNSHPGIHVIHQVHALSEAGRLVEADELAETAHQLALGSGPPWGRVWFGAQLGRIAARRGRPRRARRFLVEATTLAADCGFRGARRLTLSYLAMVEAWLGDAAAANACAAELGGLEPFAYLRAEQQLGPAWAAVARGDLEAGRGLLRAAADDALDAGFVTSAAWVLHDLARLGDPVTARDRLAAVTPQCEGPLVPACAAHALALCGRRGDALAACAERFEALGADLLAAEAAVGASDALRREGHRRAAGEQRARADALADRCEGARTPALVTVSVTAGADTDAPALSPREREIAVLAATRLPAQAIADRLHLSVRTVNNHLQRVYTKLGVSGRAELADALDRAGT
jgi:DNA-binding CsgD family transcriptional regulator